VPPTRLLHGAFQLNPRYFLLDPQGY
jgi:hypothetical protein